MIHNNANSRQSLALSLSLYIYIYILYIYIYTHDQCQFGNHNRLSQRHAITCNSVISCTILYYLIIYYSLLWYSILYYDILYYTTLYYDIVDARAQSACPLSWSDPAGPPQGGTACLTQLHIIYCSMI